MPFTTEKGITLNITLSVGIYTSVVKEDDFNDIKNKADEALYISKRNGRDRITLWKKEAN